MMEACFWKGEVVAVGSEAIRMATLLHHSDCLILANQDTAVTDLTGATIKIAEIVEMPPTIYLLGFRLHHLGGKSYHFTTSRNSLVLSVFHSHFD
jgi:hypothetical protein